MLGNLGQNTKYRFGIGIFLAYKFLGYRFTSLALMVRLTVFKCQQMTGNTCG